MVPSTVTFAGRVALVVAEHDRGRDGNTVFAHPPPGDVEIGRVDPTYRVHGATDPVTPTRRRPEMKGTAVPWQNRKRILNRRPRC